MNRKGIRVEGLDETLATGTGVRPGDRILRVNGYPVEDELDCRFYAAGDGAQVEVERARGGAREVLQLTAQGIGSLGFAPMRSRRCRNRCLFCFVDQLPDGLRPSLYVKDEDYRFSFLYGNYVTLASLKDEELERISRLRLQPLYVSVHATEPAVRNRVLGRKTSRDIMETLGLLADAGITVHTQVVLCPGINDGAVLEKSVRDLAGLYPSVKSVAIVPVGLTRYRKQKGLCPVRSLRTKDSIEIINKIEMLQEIFKVKYKDRFVFLADEFYRQSNRPFPPAHEYQDFPQWENGVGMVAMFCRQWQRRRKKKSAWTLKGSNDYWIPTGEAAYPFLLPYVRWLGTALSASLKLFPIRNHFFGKRVTVAGLITGRDIVKQLRPHLTQGSVLVVPGVMLSREGNRFLDDFSLEEMAETLSVPVEKFNPDPDGFEKALRNHAKEL